MRKIKNITILFLVFVLLLGGCSVGTDTRRSTSEKENKTLVAPETTFLPETTKEQDSSGGERTTTSSTENKTMITSNSNDPVVLKTSEAKIKGVIVVASGASDPTVKELLYDAVKTSLQISGHQVEIYEK